MAIKEINPTSDDFPIIDFSDFAQGPARVSKDLFDAARTWGFLILKGHGIPMGDVDEMFDMSKDFFSQPQEVKAEKYMNTQQIGYDYKESMFGIQEGQCFGDIAGTTLSHPNLSSYFSPERRQTVENFRDKCHALTMKLLTAFTLSMGLDPDTLLLPHSPDKAPGNVLRMIKYPKLDSAPGNIKDIPRLGEHTDWGTLTLLFAKTKGLEVRSPSGKTWVQAPVVPGAVVVNIADGLALWSKGLLRSTVHRLSWQSLPWNMDRYSMAYFVNANADAPLKFLHLNTTTQKYTEKSMDFNATFGDYQAVRMRIIHEKFDSDGTEGELKVDKRFYDMVRGMGVAHGAGVDFEGAEDRRVDSGIEV
ncbi:hypothetical protein B0J14DRAFT_644128 [Halenospora varia]|nr:hypothetical protein B0J14DRAFT_644128 [Halenospora varia]